MSYASHLLQDWRRRTGQHSALDAAFQFETDLLQEILIRLEVALEDEEIPEEKIHRVLRSMLHGSPSPAAARLRIHQEREMIKLLQLTPPPPAHLPVWGALPRRKMRFE